MKTVLIHLLLAATSACTVSACSEAISGSESKAGALAPIQGAWRTKVQFRGGALSDLHDLEFMYSFNAGGTLTQSSNYDGTPPVPPGYGVWRQTGARTFELKYSFYEPAKFIKRRGRAAAWVPGGRGLYTETLELSADGQTYKSRIVYDLVDPAGVPVSGGGEGEATGSRITFDSTT